MLGDSLQGTSMSFVFLLCELTLQEQRNVWFHTPRVRLPLHPMGVEWSLFAECSEPQELIRYLKITVRPPRQQSSDRISNLKRTTIPSTREHHLSIEYLKYCGNQEIFGATENQTSVLSLRIRRS